MQIARAAVPTVVRPAAFWTGTGACAGMPTAAYWYAWQRARMLVQAQDLVAARRAALRFDPRWN